MINYLHIALWIVCFYDAIVMLLLPSRVNFIFGTDGSIARYVVDFLALGIAGYVLTTKGFKKLENKWIAIFLILLVISHFHSPNINFQSTFLPNDMAIYNYKPLFEILVFFLMFLGVSSIEISKDMLNKIFKSLCWIAVIYSGYIFLQRAGLDQIYALTGDQLKVEMSRNPECGGFMSQPVFAAALLAMCVPFLVRNGSNWMLGTTLLGILATGNRSALIASIVCIVMMVSFRIGLALLFTYIGILMAICVTYWFFPNLSLHFATNERYDVWKNLFLDFVNPSFPGINSHYVLTGHGIGSFPVIFPFYHNSQFHQAHNELFEIIWTTGLCGLGVTILMVKDFLYRITNITILVSLIAISICAFTNAVWHIPQLAFVTVFLLGLSYNKTMGEYYVETRTI